MNKEGVGKTRKQEIGIPDYGLFPVVENLNDHRFVNADSFEVTKQKGWLIRYCPKNWSPYPCSFTLVKYIIGNPKII
jgi:hypothetical protein